MGIGPVFEDVGRRMARRQRLQRSTIGGCGGKVNRCEAASLRDMEPNPSGCVNLPAIVRLCNRTADLRAGRQRPTP